MVLGPPVTPSGVEALRESKKKFECFHDASPKQKTSDEHCGGDEQAETDRQCAVKSTPKENEQSGHDCYEKI